MKKKISPTGNWTPVSRVTGGDTHHYTIEDGQGENFHLHNQFIQAILFRPHNIFYLKLFNLKLLHKKKSPLFYVLKEELGLKSFKNS